MSVRRCHFSRSPINRLVGHRLKPIGESLWAVDKEVRRTCIVSKTEARAFSTTAERRKESVDESWLCHLD